MESVKRPSEDKALSQAAAHQTAAQYSEKPLRNDGLPVFKYAFDASITQSMPVSHRIAAALMKPERPKARTTEPPLLKQLAQLQLSENPTIALNMMHMTNAQAAASQAAKAVQDLHARLKTLHPETHQLIIEKREFTSVYRRLTAAVRDAEKALPNMMQAQTTAQLQEGATIAQKACRKAQQEKYAAERIIDQQFDVYDGSVCSIS